jgi:Icc protein
MRFAVCTDIHYGFDQANKKGSQAARLIERFVRVANKNRVDFYVDLGDRVIYRAPEQDRFYMKSLRDHFNQAAAPHHKVDGNHDRRNLTAEENGEIMGTPAGSYSRVFGGFRTIFWSPNVTPDKNRQLDVLETEIEWLQNELDTSSEPCVLFTHVPLHNLPHETMPGDTPDENKWIFPSYYIRQSQQIREMLEQSGKVKLCMAGHLHHNTHRKINGIHYVLHQSLVQKNERTGHARGAFSIIDINDKTGEIKITGYGVGQKSRILNFPV